MTVKNENQSFVVMRLKMPQPIGLGASCETEEKFQPSLSKSPRKKTQFKSSPDSKIADSLFHE
jgi:hypothetical protein